MLSEEEQEDMENFSLGVLHNGELRADYCNILFKDIEHKSQKLLWKSIFHSHFIHFIIKINKLKIV